MIRGLCLLSLVFGLFLGPSLVNGDSRISSKRPLDLPAGGRGQEDEAEDAPETIVFYGSEYEGDGFFWCLDKSCSMLGVQLDTLKSEVNSAISSLSNRADIGVVAFSTNFVVWRTIPSRANPANKASATSWVLSLTAGGGTILAPAGVQTVQINNISTKRKKTVIVVGDGRPADEEAALNDITMSNFQDTPINTLLIQDTTGMSFMQALAAMNGGTFRYVP